MARLTQKQTDGSYTLVHEQQWPQALEKLAMLENLYEELLKNQQTLSAELEQLRLQGKKNSYQFRERMGKKLQNSDAISLLKAHGLNH